MENPSHLSLAELFEMHPHQLPWEQFLASSEVFKDNAPGAQREQLGLAFSGGLSDLASASFGRAADLLRAQPIAL